MVFHACDVLICVSVAALPQLFVIQSVADYWRRRSDATVLQPCISDSEQFIGGTIASESSLFRSPHLFDLRRLHAPTLFA
jgi:hypothetical protein